MFISPVVDFFFTFDTLWAWDSHSDYSIQKLEPILVEVLEFLCQHMFFVGFCKLYYLLHNTPTEWLWGTAGV